MYRVVIYLMPGSISYANSIRSERRTESTVSSGLAIDHSRNKIVLNDIIVATAKIDAVCAPCLPIVVLNAANLIAIDRERTRSAVNSHVNAVICCAGRHVTFDPDGIAGND